MFAVICGFGSSALERGCLHNEEYYCSPKEAVRVQCVRPSQCVPGTLGKGCILSVWEADQISSIGTALKKTRRPLLIIPPELPQLCFILLCFILPFVADMTNLLCATCVLLSSFLSFAVWRPCAFPSCRFSIFCYFWQVAFCHCRFFQPWKKASTFSMKYWSLPGKIRMIGTWGYTNSYLLPVSDYPAPGAAKAFSQVSLGRARIIRLACSLQA